MTLWNSVLARNDGEVVDGHLRLKAARKLGITEKPDILCDEWTPAQVKDFRLLVNRSVTWADWDEELLTLELQELAATDCDLSLTGFRGAGNAYHSRRKKYGTISFTTLLLPPPIPPSH